MQDTQREILTAVAAGSLTPAEAAARLDEMEREPTQTHVSRITSSGSEDIGGVRVHSSYGRVMVHGDASVDQAIAEGPHVARQENGILVIETEQVADGDFRFGRRDGGRWWSGLLGPTVMVRMNPRLEAWIAADAGTVTVRNLLGPIHAEVQAGSLVVEGFAGPVDLAASAGSIRADGSLREGASRIRCEMGSIRLALAPDSDVRVSAIAHMGKLNLDNGDRDGGRSRRWGERQETVFGAGTASLAIESEMGSVTVSRSE